MPKKIKPNRDIKNRNPRLFFTGLTMGIADLIPGVSGGTIAFLFGIYDELLYSIKLITSKVPRLIFTGKFKKSFNIIPFSFLIPVGLGILAAIFGLVHTVTYLLDNQPILVWSFFFGLVIGSVHVVSRRLKSWDTNKIICLALGFILTFIFVGLPNFGGNSSALAVFGTGVVAITAMILPGISGSLIMVILGQYEIVINAVANRDIATMSVFALGAITGLALFVQLLTWLLKRYHMAVIAFLIGVMAGSLRRIWPWQNIDVNGNSSNYFPQFEWGLILVICLAFLGYLVVYMLEKVGIAKEHDDIETKEFKEEFKEDLEN